MHFAVPDEHPTAVDDHVTMKFGAKRVMFLFLVTIATAVGFHSVLHIPPVFGMMAGLAYLKLYGFYLRRRGVHLLLCDLHSSVEICSCRFLGFPAAALEQRLGRLLPRA